MSEIAVIGAGAWGTAISIVLGRKGTHQVRLWAHESEVRESIEARRVNEMFLPGESLPNTVICTNDLEEALRDANFVVSVMPSHHTRRIFEAMKPHLRAQTLFVSATKGIENDSLLRMTQVISQVLQRAAADSRRGSAPSADPHSPKRLRREIRQPSPSHPPIRN